MVGDVNHNVLIKDSPPMAAATPGTLYQPMLDGETVEGGMRERLSKGDLRKLEEQQARDE